MVSELRTESQPGRHHVVLRLPSDVVLKGTSNSTVVQGPQGPAIYINGRAIPITLPAGIKIGDRVELAQRPDGSVAIRPLSVGGIGVETAARLLESLRAVLPRHPVAIPERLLELPQVTAQDLAAMTSAKELRDAIGHRLQVPMRNGVLEQALRSALVRSGDAVDDLLQRLEQHLATAPSAGRSESTLRSIDPLLRLLRATPNSSVTEVPVRGQVAQLLLDSHLNFSLEQVERVRDILRSIGDEHTVQVLLRLVQALDRLLGEPQSESDRELVRFLKELREFLESKPQGEVLRRVLQSYLDRIIDKYVAPEGGNRWQDLSPRFARSLVVLTSNLESALQQLGTGLTPRALLQDPALAEILSVTPKSGAEERIQTALRVLVERVKEGAPMRESIQRFLSDHAPFGKEASETKQKLIGQVLQQALTEEIQRLSSPGAETVLQEVSDLKLPAGLLNYQRMGPPQISELLKEYSVRYVLSLVADRQLAALSDEPLPQAFVQFLEQTARGVTGRTTEQPRDDRPVVRQGLERLKELFFEERRNVPLVKEAREDQRLLHIVESATQAQELLTRMLPMAQLTQGGTKEGVTLLPIFAFGMLQLVQFHHEQPRRLRRAEHEKAAEDSEYDEAEQRLSFDVEFTMLGRVSVELTWGAGRLRGRFIVGHETIKKFLSRRLSTLRHALLGLGLAQVEWAVWTRPQ
ncbi:MAG: hypothetical protein QY326_00870 [Bdellovibrionota bacterium]|nr:MAG: hypothetical protein QY326_00870 [Bdellovibrionota bacterium]